MARIGEDVIAVMKARAPLNFEICGEIADEFGLKQRAIAASATRNGIAYDKKARVSKNGGEVVTKEDLVATIAENLDLEAKDLDGLEKATKVALTKVVAGLVKDEA